MAYYYNSYQPDLQDYNYSASYGFIENTAMTGNFGYGNYEYAMPQSSILDYNYAINNQDSISPYQYYQHQPAYNYYADNDFTVGYSYSVSTHSHPNLIEFNPSASAYSRVYSPAQTQSIISYSVSDFNEPEFPEYDPTPYGGGYDITKTYGKPLPPSEEICYPRSKIDTNAQILGGLSAKSPYSGEDQVNQTAKMPQNGSKPTVLAAEEERKETAEKPENGRTTTTVLAAEEDQQEPVDDSDLYTSSDSESDKNEDLEETIVDRPHPVPDNSAGTNDEFSARQVPQLPLPGYGLEAMDVCESLFGYWPCLSRYQRECARQRAVDGELSCNNDWQVAADYLFGGHDPYAYGDRRGYGTSCVGSHW